MTNLDNFRKISTIVTGKKERIDAYGPHKIKEEFSSYGGSVKSRIKT